MGGERVTGGLKGGEGWGMQNEKGKVQNVVQTAFLLGLAGISGWGGGG